MTPSHVMMRTPCETSSINLPECFALPSDAQPACDSCLECWKKNAEQGGSEVGESLGPVGRSLEVNPGRSHADTRLEGQPCRVLKSLRDAEIIVELAVFERFQFFS